jgi:hypothetical protein
MVVVFAVAPGNPLARELGVPKTEDPACEPPGTVAGF